MVAASQLCSRPPPGRSGQGEDFTVTLRLREGAREVAESTTVTLRLREGAREVAESTASIDLGIGREPDQARFGAGYWTEPGRMKSSCVHKKQPGVQREPSESSPKQTESGMLDDEQYLGCDLVT